jgi:hypothetical protein
MSTESGEVVDGSRSWRPFLRCVCQPNLAWAYPEYADRAGVLIVLWELLLILVFLHWRVPALRAQGFGWSGLSVILHAYTLLTQMQALASRPLHLHEAKAFTPRTRTRRWSTDLPSHSLSGLQDAQEIADEEQNMFVPFSELQSGQKEKSIAHWIDKAPSPASQYPGQPGKPPARQTVSSSATSSTEDDQPLNRFKTHRAAQEYAAGVVDEYQASPSLQRGQGRGSGHRGPDW